MGKDVIIDNATEMSVEDMNKTLASMPSKETAKMDVKEQVGSSPTAEHASDDEPTTIEEYQARIKGLQAELGRRKGNAERVEQLEGQLEYMKGQLDTLTATKTENTAETRFKEAVGKLDDKALVSKQGDWEEELVSLRSKYDRAEETGDTDKMQNLAQKIANAKWVITELRTETLSRAERRANERTTQQNETEAIQSELSEMYDSVKEAFPDFQDQDSDLWKAGLAEYEEHPVLMSKLGIAGEVVAAALAIVKNPDLVGAKATASARKEVIEKIDRGLTHALRTGGSSPSTNRQPVFNVDSGDGLADFNKYVDKVKGG